MPAFSKLLLALSLTAAYAAVAWTYSQNKPAAGCLAGAILTMILGIYVVCKRPNSRLNWSYFVLSMALTAFLGLVYLLHMAATTWSLDDVKRPVQLFRFGNLLIPTALMWFNYEYTRRSSRLLLGLIPLSALTMAPAIFLNFLNRYITHYQRFEFTYMPADTLLYRYVAVVTGCWLALWWIHLMARAFLSHDAGQGRRDRLLLAAGLVVLVPPIFGFTAAFSDIRFPASVGSSVVVFSVLMAIGVLRYNMFDIRIVIRRTLPYAAVSGLIGVLHATTLSGVHYIGAYLGGMPAGINWVLLLSLVGFGFQPTLEGLQRGLDRLCFRQEAEFDRILATAGEQYSRALSIDELLGLLAGDLRSAMLLDDVSVLVDRRGRRIAVSDPPMAGLSVVTHDLDLKSVPGRETWLQQDIPGDANTAAVSFRCEDVHGVVLLGPKMSDMPMSGRDRLLTTALVAQAEVALSRLIAQEAASRARDLTKIVFDTINNAIALLDDNGRCLECNEAFRRFFGPCSRFDMTALGLDIPTIAGGAMVEVVVGEGSYLINARKFESGNGDAGAAIVAVFTDVTELRKLQQVARSKESLAEIGQMISTINHEIMNIMTPIGFYLRNAQRAASKDDLHVALAGLKERLDSLQTMSRDLRDYYRNPSLYAEPTDLSIVIRSVLVDLTAIAGPGWSPPRVEADGIVLVADVQKLKQVLLNILKNAWEAVAHMPKPQWEIVAVRRESMAAIAIGDRGAGIAPQNMRNLFKPFFSTKADRGTGLGLAVAKKIVEAHGAHIDVVSEEGRGTSVHLLWPLATEEKRSS